MSFHPDSLPDLAGKVFVVTGGNSGIGLEAVKRLVEHHAHVYLCARSAEKANTAIKDIKATYPEATVDFVEMDQMSFESVVKAADVISSKATTIHGLLNNAGIMATPFEITKDGFEGQWQTNYLAHWLFTAKLMPILLATAKGQPPGSVRIVNISSHGHRLAPKEGLNFEDTSLKDASRIQRYGQSKLANILHAKSLHKMYGPGSDTATKNEGEIWVTSLHPGVIGTNLASTARFPWYIDWPVRLAIGLGVTQSVDDGARPSLFCVASPDMKAEQSGKYFQRLDAKDLENDLAKDEQLADRLNEWTIQTMGEKGYSF